jgi:hypothetical protein
MRIDVHAHHLTWTIGAPVEDTISVVQLITHGGTDFPYENGDTFLRAVDYINDPQIDRGAARAILDHNASALLGLG